jgi:hypothetical protein
MKTFTSNVFAPALILTTWAGYKVRLALTSNRAARFRLMGEMDRFIAKWERRLAK